MEAIGRNAYRGGEVSGYGGRGVGFLFAAEVVPRVEKGGEGGEVRETVVFGGGGGSRGGWR